MTLSEAASDFWDACCCAPWLRGITTDGERIVAETSYELPGPLKEKLATWQGWPVVFCAVGRVCIP